MTKITDDLAESGVEVLKRIAVATLSLDDASFIAGWVHDARNALRAQGGVKPLEEAARNASMYLRTGFIECDRCGHEVQTANTDAQYELDVALSSLEASPAPVSEEMVEASCPGCQGTGDQGGNPSYGACDDCNGTGKVNQPLPAALAAKGGQ